MRVGSWKERGEGERGEREDSDEGGGGNQVSQSRTRRGSIKAGVVGRQLYQEVHRPQFSLLTLKSFVMSLTECTLISSIAPELALLTVGVSGQLHSQGEKEHVA